MKTIILQMLLSFLAFAVNAQTFRIMPLGNSITQANNSHFSYRYNLWEKLNNSALGVTFDFVGSMNTNFNGSPTYPNASFDRDHEGHWGWFANQLLADLPGWLANYTPDIVLVHAGSNDALNSHTTSGTVAEIEQIIDVLRADNPNVTILLAKLIPVNNPSLNTNINALNAEIPRIVSRKNTVVSRIILVDQNTGFNASTDTYDGIHPNSSGEEKMAQKWFDAIMALDQFEEENSTNSPHVISIELTTKEDVDIFLTAPIVKAAYSDVDGDQIKTIKILTLSAKCLLSVDGSSVATGQIMSIAEFSRMKISPKSNMNGPTSFKIEAIDDRGLAVTHEIKVNILPVNDSPTFGSFEITKKDSKVMYLEGKVIDVDHPISSLIFNVSSNNQAVVADRDLSFKLVRDKIEIKVGAFTEGKAKLKITAHDGTHTGTGYATLNITNTAHTMDLAFEINEDEALIFHTSTFMKAFSDVDGDHLRAIKILKLPSKGTLVFDGTNVTVGTGINADKIDKLRFVPDSNISGETSFTFESIDERGLAVEVVSVIVINAVNDAPELETIEDQEIDIETIEDVIMIPLVISDVDTPASSLTLVAISDNQTVVADEDLSIHNSILAIKTSDMGIAKITVTISDGQHQFSQEFTVTINLITDIESEISRGFYIFPNPADADYIFISCPENSSPQMEYHIVDNRGVLVEKGKSSEFEETNLLRININGLQPGLYLIKCMFPGGYKKSMKFFRK